MCLFLVFLWCAFFLLSVFGAEEIREPHFDGRAPHGIVEAHRSGTGVRKKYVK